MILLHRKGKEHRKAEKLGEKIRTVRLKNLLFSSEDNKYNRKHKYLHLNLEKYIKTE